MNAIVIALFTQTFSFGQCNRCRIQLINGEWVLVLGGLGAVCLSFKKWLEKLGITNSCYKVGIIPPKSVNDI